MRVYSKQQGDAIWFTGENVKEVEELFGARYRVRRAFGGRLYEFFTPWDDSHLLQVNNWIVRSDDGDVHILSEEEFAERYEVMA